MFKAYILSTSSPPKQPVTSPPLSSSFPRTEETDGSQVSQSYLQQRATSPILKDCKSPTQTGESLLEYCGRFGGPVLAPLTIHPCPLKCKLVPSYPAEDASSTASTSSSPQAKTEKLVTISKAGEIAKEEAGVPQDPLGLQGISELPTPPLSSRASPGLVRRERGISRHLTSYTSMHKRLSHLCKHQISGPTLSLQVVESRSSS